MNQSQLLQALTRAFVVTLMPLLYACTAQQVAVPVMVGGALVAPLVMPVVWLGEGCDMPAPGVAQTERGERMVAATCDIWPVGISGWIDDAHLLYWVRNDYYIHLARTGQSVRAEDVFADFARHKAFPCTDGRGVVRSIRRRWDDDWYVRYDLAAPQQDPYVRQITAADDPLAGCPAYPPTVALSPDGCFEASIRRGEDANGAGYVSVIAVSRCSDTRL